MTDEQRKLVTRIGRMDFSMFDAKGILEIIEEQGKQLARYEAMMGDALVLIFRPMDCGDRNKGRLDGWGQPDEEVHHQLGISYEDGKWIIVGYDDERRGCSSENDPANRVGPRDTAIDAYDALKEATK